MISGSPLCEFSPSLVSFMKFYVFYSRNKDNRFHAYGQAFGAPVFQIVDIFRESVYAVGICTVIIISRSVFIEHDFKLFLV